jgi:hypothetical protein
VTFEQIEEDEIGVHEHNLEKLFEEQRNIPSMSFELLDPHLEWYWPKLLGCLSVKRFASLHQNPQSDLAMF